MTLSILACDFKTGELAAAALTGNLCVGGWVLRADLRWGVIASQGAIPSTLWAGQVFHRLSRGTHVDQAVQQVVEADEGRAHRQLGVVDVLGQVASFTGDLNIAKTVTRVFSGGLALGNMLSSKAVVDSAVDAFMATDGPIAQRLIHAIAAGDAAGGDFRGAQSAALLCLSRSAPPLDLRIDDSSDPVAALNNLYEKTCQPAYQRWLANLPTDEQPTKYP